MLFLPGGTTIGMLTVAAPVARSVWKDSLKSGDRDIPSPIEPDFISLVGAAGKAVGE